MKLTQDLSFTMADKVGSLIRKKPDISLDEAADALGVSIRTLHRHLLKEKKITFKVLRTQILTELNVIEKEIDNLTPTIPVKKPTKPVKSKPKPKPIVEYDEFDDFDDFDTSPEIEEPIEPRIIPKEITTELMEQETLREYYSCDDPKDRQRLLSIMQSIWAVKHKVPTENTNKTQSMEDLLARLSQDC
jgi:hypothetical protein